MPFPLERCLSRSWPIPVSAAAARSTTMCRNGVAR
jgi:hypothetical protein